MLVIVLPRFGEIRRPASEGFLYNMGFSFERRSLRASRRTFRAVPMAKRNVILGFPWPREAKAVVNFGGREAKLADRHILNLSGEALTEMVEDVIVYPLDCDFDLAGS